MPAGTDETPVVDRPDAPDDPIRARLGRIGRVLPATHHRLELRPLLQVATRLSVLRSLYYSRRFKGRFVIARGTRIVTQRTSRVEFASGSWLLVGFHHHGPDRALINLGRDATLVINGTAQFWRGSQIMVFKGGRLEIGDKNIINERARIICYRSIRFGNGSGLSWDCTAIDSDLHPIWVKGRQLPTELPIEIGDHVFAGAGSTILKGVRIGDGSVVGAGAVVTKDVPPRTLVAGNPARVIHEDIDWL
jgi:acetyltransferase-like isoleucine patch superfamily enzyme